jgi:hypothetical protein
MFSNPKRVARSAIIGGCERGGGTEVCDGTRKSILKEAAWIDWR